MYMKCPANTAMFCFIFPLICVLYKESHYCYVLSVHVFTAFLNDVIMACCSITVKN
ncbi:hypothetical protein ACRRTK_020310 [Alexandromys fortis]